MKSSKGLLPAYIIGLLVSVILVVIILLILSLIMGTITALPGTRSPIETEIVVKSVYLPLLADRALYSLLSTKDLQTGLQISELLAYAAYYKKTSFQLNVDGQTFDVNVEKIVDTNMKFLAKGKEYKLEVGESLQLGNKKIVSKFTSLTTLTLPDLKKVKLTLYLG